MALHRKKFHSCSPLTSFYCSLLSIGKSFLCWITIFVTFFLGLSNNSFAGPQHKFYYFNPDSLQSNLSNLKREMDNYFSRTDFAVIFQPFAHRVDLEQAMNTNVPSFLLVPEWFLKAYGEEFHIRPLLIPIRNGKKTYHKVLLASSHLSFDIKNIKNKSLAMTTMGDSGEDILNNILFRDSGLTARDVNIVYVPKDSDALFALALGQVDMAFVVKETIEKISSINPRITQSIRPLITSSEISMPILGYIEGVVSDDEIRKFKEIFMNKSDQKIIMEMLKIDDWQIYTK